MCVWQTHKCQQSNLNGRKVQLTARNTNQKYKDDDDTDDDDDKIRLLYEGTCQLQKYSTGSE